MRHIHHINLQAAVGGGEVYTRSFTRALVDAGARVTLYVNAANRFWDSLAGEDIEVVAVQDASELAAHLPQRNALIVTQSPLPIPLLASFAHDHRLTGFAHMPILGRSAKTFAVFAQVMTVSQYCIDLLRAAGIEQTHAEPMYGTFMLERAEAREIVAGSPYHYDRRKGRDRLLSAIEPLRARLRPKTVFKRNPGLTLGVVSLLSPIKQFPQLFTLLAPILARTPGVHLEVFGNGGYAQVRDLRRALAPLSADGRVRFWGYQSAVQLIYPELDYLMTGLPEKEALGLNVLEAQACGTPVLGPNAPPFTETIVHGRSGFLYRDPRQDAGRDFAQLLDALGSGVAPRPDPRTNTAHLEKFSYPALVARTRRWLASAPA